MRGGEDRCLQGVSVCVCVCAWVCGPHRGAGESETQRAEWVGEEGEGRLRWPCEKELIKVTFVGDAWGSEASFGTCVRGAKLTVNTNNQSAGPIERWRQWNEGERLEPLRRESKSQQSAARLSRWRSTRGFHRMEVLTKQAPASPLTEGSSAALLLFQLLYGDVLLFLDLFFGQSRASPTAASSHLCGS